jgi:putative transcriptional regulator
VVRRQWPAPRRRSSTFGRLAEERGVSRQTVISLEKRRFDPSPPLAFRIAALFDCRIEDVFTPDGD